MDVDKLKETFRGFGRELKAIDKALTYSLVGEAKTEVKEFLILGKCPECNKPILLDKKDVKFVKEVKE